VSGNIAVIYAGDLEPVAEAFSEAARHLAARVRLLRLAASDTAAEGAPRERAALRDLEWADGIAFGTPIGDGHPARELMRFIESTGRRWSHGRLGAMYDKVVTVFTDEPEHMAPDSVLHPIYDALYAWGAVIVGPRGFELELDAAPGDDVVEGSSPLSASRLRSARHRAFRLARLAGVLAEDHARRGRLQL
jgi:NAD(P)H dehydrogenase (quinone)